MSGIGSIIGSPGAVAPDPTDASFSSVGLFLDGNALPSTGTAFHFDGSSSAYVSYLNGQVRGTGDGPVAGYGSAQFVSSTTDYVRHQIGSNTTPLDIGSGNFTLECWVNPTTTGSAQEIFYVGLPGSTAASNQNLQLEVTSSGTVRGLIASSSTAYAAVSSATLSTGTWTHVALVRNGNTLTVYVGGSSTGSTTANVTGVTANAVLSTWFAYTGAAPTPGNYFNGKVHSLRLVKGTALYTANFTPPTAPLTNVSGTTFLSCIGSHSTNVVPVEEAQNALVTKAGSPTFGTFSPFSGTPYSNTTHGASMRTFATPDYVTFPGTSSTQMGSGDFTIEAWIYPTQNSANSYYTWMFNGANNVSTGGQFYFPQRNLGVYIFLSTTGGGSWDVHGVSGGYSCGTMTLNAWNHVAIVRSGNTFSGYMNGTRGTTFSFNGVQNSGFASAIAAGTALNASTQPVSLGAQSGGAEPTAGYISGFRMVKGTALYSGTTYTVPTTPPTAVSGTGALLNFAPGVKDISSTRNHIAVNAANITNQRMFGTGSLLFNGTTSYCRTPYNAAFNFGSGNFTIEGFVYTGTTTGTQTICYLGTPGSAATSTLSGYQFDIASGLLRGGVIVSSSSVSATTATTIPTNAWNHVAFVKNGTTLTVYLNGTAGATTGTTSSAHNTNSSTYYLYIGSNPVPGNYFNGMIDSLRITKGVARYTSNFTAPVIEFAKK